MKIQHTFGIVIAVVLLFLCAPPTTDACKLCCWCRDSNDAYSRSSSRRPRRNRSNLPPEQPEPRGSKREESQPGEEPSDGQGLTIPGDIGTGDEARVGNGKFRFAAQNSSLTDVQLGGLVNEMSPEFHETMQKLLQNAEEAQMRQVDSRKMAVPDSLEAYLKSLIDRFGAVEKKVDWLIERHRMHYPDDTPPAEDTALGTSPESES